MLKNNEQQVNPLGREAKPPSPQNNKAVSTAELVAKQISQLKRDLDDKVTENTQLKKYLSDHETASQAQVTEFNTKLETMIQIHAEQIKNLNSQLGLAQAKSEEAEQLLAEVKATIEKDSKKYLAIEHQNNELTALVAKYENEIKAFKSQIDTAKAELASTITKNDEQIAQFSLTLQESLKKHTEITSQMTTEKQTFHEIHSEAEEFILSLSQKIEEWEHYANSRKTLEIELRHTIQELENELTKSDRENLDLISQIASSQEKIATLETEIGELRDDATQAQTTINRLELLNAHLHHQLSPAFFSNAQAREKRATDAIALLEKEMTGNPQSTRNKAIQTIVNHLKEGLKNTDAQAYFDAHKVDLRRQIHTLNHWKSIATTAINAILTVIAVVSVVGITALWLTGTLENNLAKKGSIFAFCAADKQKANRALYELEQSLSIKIAVN